MYLMMVLVPCSSLCSLSPISSPISLCHTWERLTQHVKIQGKQMSVEDQGHIYIYIYDTYMVTPTRTYLELLYIHIYILHTYGYIYIYLYLYVYMYSCFRQVHVSTQHLPMLSRPQGLEDLWNEGYSAQAACCTCGGGQVSHIQGHLVKRPGEPLRETRNGGWMVAQAMGR